MKTLIITIACLLMSNVQAVDHTFTYQGELMDSNNAANGSYDIVIQAFDAASSGNTVGSVSTHNGIIATNGIFTVTDVDLGIGLYNGLDIWLQISVKKTVDVNYTALSPLQKMRSVPYATTLIDKGATDGQVLAFDDVNGWQPANANSSTDDQNIENLGLNGTTLTVGIENGISQNVDLTSLQDGTGTDSQNLTLLGRALGITNAPTVVFTGWDINAADDFTGNYNDLSNKPSFAGWDTNTSDDFSGDYNDLSNQPWAFDGFSASRITGFTGLGVATPEANLHIKMSSAGSVSGGIRLESASSSGVDWYIRMPASDDLLIRNDATDVLTIKRTTGDVEMVGELQGDVSGDADMKAYIYGRVNAAGDIITTASSSGFSVIRISEGTYEINFDDSPDDPSAYMVLASPLSFRMLFLFQGSESFVVLTRDTSSLPLDSNFNFVVYKK
jgi:hypothetical protein